jgi:hypothetical protein
MSPASNTLGIPADQIAERAAEIALDVFAVALARGDGAFSSNPF